MTCKGDPLASGCPGESALLCCKEASFDNLVSFDAFREIEKAFLFSASDELLYR